MDKRTIEVAEGEYTTIPGTREYVLIGPGRLSITKRGDGSVHGRILEGSPSPADLAARKQLKRRSWE